MVLPYLSSISIYPVKSLGALSVNTVRVLPSGALADDRRFAIFDAQGKYVNAKRNARVHLLRSSYDSGSRHLRLSTIADSRAKSFNVDSERSALQDWLSEFFGFAVSFQEEISAGFPDDTDSPGPTLISTATLREVGGWFGLSVEQARARFRTNLEIDGVPAFWEDRLYGEQGTTVRFRVGDVAFDGVNPCQRCVVPARDAMSGIDVRDFAKRFVEMRRKRLPEWATLSRFNHFYRLAVNTKLVANQSALHLTVGDPIQIIKTVADPLLPPTPQLPADVAATPIRWCGKLAVRSVSESAPDVRTFRLSSTENSPLPFTYLPGQHLVLELLIDGITHRRCYTIASSPTQTQYLELTVKREAAGSVSRYLHDHLYEGMHLRVSGPGGRFTFTGDEADSILLIGAGVGITPLMSVVRYLTDRRWTGSIDLIYSAKNERSIIFKDELKLLAETSPNLRVTITLTQEPDANWAGPRGRINHGLLRQTLQRASNCRVHICGPVEMANATLQMLCEIGVPAEQIRTEAFGGRAPTSAFTAVTDVSGPVIGIATFTDSGNSAPIHSTQNVLDIATSVGVAIDHGCEAGVCGRCKVRLLAGNVTMEVDDGLSEDEKEDGFILACQAKPCNSVVVEA